MAITTTDRVAGYRWTAGTDEFTREQLDTSHANFEARIGTFYSGPTANRPTTALNTTYARSFYLDTSLNILYYCTGASDSQAWVAVNSFAAPGAVTPGATASAGTATTLARSDHQHSLFAFATGTSAVSTAASAGTADTFSRGDHVHVLANGAVTAGKIAAGAINSSSLFTTGVVTSSVIADDAVTRNKIVATERIPVGTIIPYVGLTAPTGWMMCEGGEISATSELGVLLGSRYGTGSAGNVRVPDLRNRVARGGTSGESPNNQWTLPATGGASSVTLVEANLPSHTHGLGTLAIAQNGSHSHTPGSLTTGDVDLAHTHTMSHTHNLGPSQVPDGSFGPRNASPQGYGIAYVNNNTGNLSISTGTGNATIQQMEKYSGNWTTTTSSTASGAMSVSGVHQHTISGSTDTAGSHTHGLTGTVANAGSGILFSIVPSYAGTSFIIKL